METKAENNMKFLKLYMVCAGLLIAVLGAAVIALSINVSKMYSYICTDETVTGETKEDDVTIAENYVIRSTTQISDAYISGNSASLSDEDKETLDMASSVLDEIITDDMTAYEKEKAVYIWMCENLSQDDGSMTVIPTTEDGSDNPHGVLKNKKAVCVGFATTFRLFMQMMEIPCHVVHNTDMYHSWDEVQLDDEWYIVDVYSDVTTCSFAHFNITDETMTNSGETWDTSYFPTAEGTRYNPATQEAVAADDIYDIPGQIRKALDAGETLVSLRYSGTLSEKDQNIAGSMIDAVSSVLWSTEAYQNMIIEYTWSEADDDTILAVYLEDFSYDDPDDGEAISDETQKKMDDAVNNAFGDIAVYDSSDDYVYDGVTE